MKHFIILFIVLIISSISLSAQSIEDYIKAAEQGNIEAQYHLALCYDKGEGVTPNSTEAAKWYLKAAEQGLAKAQFF